MQWVCVLLYHLLAVRTKANPTGPAPPAGPAHRVSPTHQASTTPPGQLGPPGQQHHPPHSPTSTPSPTPRQAPEPRVIQVTRPWQAICSQSSAMSCDRERQSTYHRSRQEFKSPWRSKAGISGLSTDPGTPASPKSLVSFVYSKGPCSTLQPSL